ncbi:hypothetical protein [Sphingobium tyrosinilyticum]|uniref:Uncharacterized protein n=1 Tax=Sphingobium tyrosinilyticum TaxID=2715436 RepID=A0ABV9EYD1_9SPHN
MNDDHLAAVGGSLGAIATRIAERVDDADGTSPIRIFEECLDRELVQLRKAGKVQLAETVATIRSPIARFLKEGW